MPAVVLALGPKPKANLSDIVRTGAVELVEYPTSKRQLAAALQRAFDIADISESGGAPTLPVVAQGVVVERPQFAEVFTVASSSGGCGKTFYATNLACYLAAQTGQRVCLVDLDLQFGEVSTALHLRPRFTISDLLSREPVDDDDLDEHVEEYLEEHELGLLGAGRAVQPRRRRHDRAQGRLQGHGLRCAGTSTTSSSTRRPSCPRSSWRRSTTPPGSCAW